MGKARVIPDRSQLVDYNYSVAGHAGTMCDADGIIFVKPCTDAEVRFYESANYSRQDFAEIMPVFMGTLNLSDPAEIATADDGLNGALVDADLQAKVVEMAQAQAQAQAQASGDAQSQENKEPSKEVDNVTWVPNKTKKIKTDTAVVLENAAYGFSNPNILDAKLGKRLWADDAPLQKKERFDKITSETTHGTHGFRIAGMRVYKGSPEAEWDEEQYKIYDKDYGRKEVTPQNVATELRRFIFNEKAGIAEELGKAVAGAFVQELRHIEEVLTSNESRMYSSSVLFVFEGDGQKLEEAIRANNELVDRANAAYDEPDQTTERVDSGIVLMDGDEADDDEDDEDGPEVPKAFQVKLIDFAHAEWTPGQGPDQNALTGVRSLIKLFEDMAKDD